MREEITPEQREELLKMLREAAAAGVDMAELAHKLGFTGYQLFTWQYLRNGPTWLEQRREQDEPQE